MQIKVNLQIFAARPCLLRQQQGLTLLELILSLSITAALIGVIAPLLVYGVDIFQFVTDRKEAFQTNRFAIQRISKELRRIPSADSILSATLTSLQFTNRNAKRMAIEASSRVLKLNKQPLLSNLKSFKLTYFDSKGSILKFPIKKPQNIWRIKFEIVLQQNSHEIRLSNEIKPRNF